MRIFYNCAIFAPVTISSITNANAKSNPYPNPNPNPTPSQNQIITLIMTLCSWEYCWINRLWSKCWITNFTCISNVLSWGSVWPIQQVKYTEVPLGHDRRWRNKMMRSCISSFQLHWDERMIWSSFFLTSQVLMLLKWRRWTLWPEFTKMIYFKSVVYSNPRTDISAE